MDLSGPLKVADDACLQFDHMSYLCKMFEIPAVFSGGGVQDGTKQPYFLECFVPSSSGFSFR